MLARRRYCFSFWNDRSTRLRSF